MGWSFKTEGLKVAYGNYDLEATCKNSHTFYIKRGDKASDYKCPYGC